MVSFLIFFSDGFPILFWSKRFGRQNALFLMPKFRTMKKNTPDLPTHKLKTTRNYLIKFGGFLRKTSLDELPQLLCVLNGSLNFVGPRPALHNQSDLIRKRSKKNIQSLRPGITGWAQINGRDDLTIDKKVELDEYYLNNKSLLLNFKIIITTIVQIFSPKGVKH